MIRPARVALVLAALLAVALPLAAAPPAPGPEADAPAPLTVADLEILLAPAPPLAQSLPRPLAKPGGGLPGDFSCEFNGLTVPTCDTCETLCAYDGCVVAQCSGFYRVDCFCEQP